MTPEMKTGKKGLNFELNLIPIFDILSVCICFLLMTVAWIQVGSLDAKQAIGGDSDAVKESAPSLWAYLDAGGRVVLTLKNTQGLPKAITDNTISGANGAVKWADVESRLAQIKQYGPALRTGLIMPDKTIAYEDIIRLMDQLKKYGIRDVGISPL